MLDSLSSHLDNFPGATNKTCCFAHTVSIVAKAVIQQFDAPKLKCGRVDDKVTHLLPCIKNWTWKLRRERKGKSISTIMTKRKTNLWMPGRTMEECWQMSRERNAKLAFSLCNPHWPRLLLVISYPNPIITNQCSHVVAQDILCIEEFYDHSPSEVVPNAHCS